MLSTHKHISSKQYFVSLKSTIQKQIQTRQVFIIDIINIVYNYIVNYKSEKCYLCDECCCEDFAHCILCQSVLRDFARNWRVFNFLKSLGGVKFES